MVDYTDVTTVHGEENKFYRIESCAFRFFLKSKGSGAIGLASSPTDDTIHWIVIGHKHSWISQTEKIKTPNIISEQEFRPFWISWYNDQIRLGIGGKFSPLVEKPKFKEINYLTFSAFKHYDVHWRLCLPLELPEPIYKEIDTGKLKWVKMTNGVLPEGALIGGYENEILYIMRAMHKMALTPGKYVPSEAAGFVAWGYQSHRKTEDIEILCGYDGIWVKTESHMIPIGAIEGGYSEVNHELLYVGRADHMGHLIPGKILCGYDCIWVPTEEDNIPIEAPICGYTEYGEDMFVGRAVYNNILMPGKIAPSHKILCGYDCFWKLFLPTIRQKYLPGAVQGGYKLTQTVKGISHAPLFVCRAVGKHGVIPGSLKTFTKSSDYASEDNSLSSTIYEILTVLDPDE